eukprot:1744190-Rhodomonas_salina.1
MSLRTPYAMSGTSATFLRTLKVPTSHNRLRHTFSPRGAETACAWAQGRKVKEKVHAGMVGREVRKYYDQHFQGTPWYLGMVAPQP